MIANDKNDIECRPSKININEPMFFMKSFDYRKWEIFK